MTVHAAAETETSRPRSTAAAEEIERFSAIADAWWDPDGEFRPLHRMNPTRIAYVRDHLAGHFGRAPLDNRPLAGLRLLDVGCGGGLLCEPMARLGAAVTGIDASQRSIAVARVHAERLGLDVDYRCTTPEAMVEAGEAFDVVLNMEVIEHVADRDAFLAASAALVRPGGATALSTLNRTLKSLALAKVGAEYVLRWLPPGTHDWRKFVRPSELAAGLRRNGVTVRDATGVVYEPLTDRWRLARDLDVNYLMFAVKG